MRARCELAKNILDGQTRYALDPPFEKARAPRDYLKYPRARNSYDTEVAANAY